jgi:hypothetical protein
MLIGAMSWGGVGGGASEGGGAGGMVESSLTKYLDFCSFYWGRRGSGGDVSHTSKPAPEDQQKTRPEAAIKALILLSK